MIGERSPDPVRIWRQPAPTACALASEVGVIDFPTLGHQTNDYDEFRHNVTQMPGAQLEYLGLALHGPKPTVTKLTGNLRLLR
jgi:hypothetical protein